MQEQVRYASSLNVSLFHMSIKVGCSVSLDAERCAQRHSIFLISAHLSASNSK